MELSVFIWDSGYLWDFRDFPLDLLAFYVTLSVSVTRARSLVTPNAALSGTRVTVEPRRTDLTALMMQPSSRSTMARIFSHGQ